MDRRSPHDTTSVKRQAGFTLVESMVSMTIGLIVVLGAGQLVMTSIQSFHAITMLNDRQAVLTFTSNALIRDIQRAQATGFDNGTLTLSSHHETDCHGTLHKQYRKGGFVEGEGWGWDYREWCNGEAPPPFQPFVAGLAEEGIDVADRGSGVWEITLRLFATPHGHDETLVIRAVSRTLAVSSP